MNYVQIVEICCRDLRRYLETVLANVKGGVVSVKTSRVAPDKSMRWRYAACISRVLRRFRRGRTYVMTKEEAAEVLETFDQLCLRRIEKKKSVRPPQRRPLFDEKMIVVSFHLPPAELRYLDEYAKEKNMTRSAAIRYAIAKMLEKMKTEERRPMPVQSAP